MTAIALALVSSLAYGITDFVAGMTARRAHVLVVGSLAQPIGVVLLLAVMPLVGGTPSIGALGWGALAGIGGAFAYFLLFRSLAIGPMSVASPLSALVSAILPVLAGLAFGEILSPLAVVGIVLGLVAVLLVSRQHESNPHPVTRHVVVMSLSSGVFISMFFIALERSPDDSGLWPLLWSRVVCGVLMAAAAAAGRFLARPSRDVVGMITLSATLDVIATVSFLLATRAGLLAIVAVIVALYPAATILLARFVLHERLQWVQRVGMALAAAAVALLAVAP